MNFRLYPHCEFSDQQLLVTILFTAYISRPPSIDRSDGFIAFVPIPMSGQIDEAVYGTLFDFRRVYSFPNVDSELLIPSPPRIPSQPQSVPVA